MNNHENKTNTMLTEQSSYAANLFKTYVKGKNLITPYVIGYYHITDKVAIELSKGRFMDTPMFGVSVCNNYQLDSELSNSFHSLEDAEKYIDTVRKSFVKTNIFKTLL